MYPEAHRENALQREEAKRKERRLLLMYEQWKLNVRKAKRSDEGRICQRVSFGLSRTA